MSDPMATMYRDLLRRIDALERRLEQTEVKEVPYIIEPTSYTPTYLGGTTAGATTYTLQSGKYARLGNIVFATGSVIWTAATGTGRAQISLPVTTANVANQNYSGSVRVDSVTFANGTPQIVILPNTAFFILQSPLSNNVSTNVDIEAAGDIVFSVWYFV